MIFDRIELKEGDSIVKKSSNKIRKIKFKSISFKNIANLWKKYRISQLEKRLENKKDKLVSMEFDSQDFTNRSIGSSMSVAEAKVIKKTKAIAKLEAKIEFLKTGNHVSETFVSSRAIKLKDNMIKNLTYNTKSVYAISQDKIRNVFETGETTPKAEMERNEVSDTQRKIAENVERIIAEKKVEDKVQVVEETSNEIPTEVPVVIVPSREEIRKTVDEMFASQEKEHIVKNSTTEPQSTLLPVEDELEKILNLQVEEVSEPVIEHSEIKESIEEILSKIDVRPVISENEVKETIEDELETVKISQNESTAAKVDKYVNEDGTYRMTRENIDDEFRITSIRRSKEDAPTMIGILRENLIKAQLIDVDEEHSKKEPDTSSAPNNPPAQEEVVRDLPIIVPERNSANKAVRQLSEAVDEVKTMDDIKQIMARVDELRKLQEQTNFKAQAIAEDSAELKAEKSQAVQELLEYQASLQEDYDSSRKKVEEQQAANEELAKEIQSIREVIGGRRM